MTECVATGADAHAQRSAQLPPAPFADIIVNPTHRCSVAYRRALAELGHPRRHDPPRHDPTPLHAPPPRCPTPRNPPMRDLQTLPKAHLHLHLELGMRPGTLAGIDAWLATPE